MRAIVTLGAIACLSSAVAMVACADQPAANSLQSAQNVGKAVPRATPAKTGFAQTDGARIAYQLYGDLASGKIPLIVLHGSLMSAESMAPMIGPFVTSRPVIAIDSSAPMVATAGYHRILGYQGVDDRRGRRAG
jgi:hypothetical protein